MGWKDVASWLLIRQLFKKKNILSAELWITRESRVYEDFPLTDYTNLGIKKSLLYICIADGPSGLKSEKRCNLWKPNCLPQKTIITIFFFKICVCFAVWFALGFRTDAKHLLIILIFFRRWLTPISTIEISRYNETNTYKFLQLK